MNTQAGGDPSGSPPVSIRAAFLPHIEVLRAVAVLAVLVFHVDPAWAPGGYIGVDVFFVISGFLITRLIVGEIDAGQFSLLQFFQRRIARLYPGLLVLLLICLVLFAILMHPRELETLGWSISAAGSFISNLYFWRTINYFGEAAAVNPLLHTWSLGAEEQFYLGFPFALLIVSRFGGRRYWLWIAAVTFALLALQIGAGRDFSANQFFLLSMRGWELGAGALVALSALPGRHSAPLRAAFAALGLGLITLAAAGFVKMHDQNLVASLLAVSGASLFVGYGDATSLSRALAVRPVQWLGRTSYSVYLWHWPIVVLFVLINYGPASFGQKLAILASSIAAGTLSYVIVERPAMARLRAMNAGAVMAMLIGCAVFFAATGAALVHFSDRLRAYSPDDQHLLRYMNYDRWGNADMRPLRPDCDYNNVGPAVFSLCVRHHPAARNIVLLGDSHAGMLAPGLVKRQLDINLIKVAGAGCRPFQLDPGHQGCAERKAYLLTGLAGSHRIDRVLLAANWQRGDEAELGRIITFLQSRGIPATVIGPEVKYTLGLPRLLLSHNPETVDRGRVSDQARLDRELEQLSVALGAQYVSPYQVNCPGGRCETRMADGTPFQWDSNHLTREAADYVIARFPQF